MAQNENEIFVSSRIREQDTMPYEYLPELATADIAFRAWSRTLEGCFVSAADALVNAMIDNLDAIQPREERRIELENEALDLLLFDFLQEPIYFKDSEQLMVRVPEVQIDRQDGKYRLRATAKGEPLDPQRHQQRVDVKAVTLHHFNLQHTPEGWEATAILDI